MWTKSENKTTCSAWFWSYLPYFAHLDFCIKKIGLKTTKPILPTLLWGDTFELGRFWMCFCGSVQPWTLTFQNNPLTLQHLFFRSWACLARDRISCSWLEWIFSVTSHISWVVPLPSKSDHQDWYIKAGHPNLNLHLPRLHPGRRDNTTHINLIFFGLGSFSRGTDFGGRCLLCFSLQTTSVWCAKRWDLRTLTTSSSM